MPLANETLRQTYLSLIADPLHNPAGNVEQQRAAAAFNAKLAALTVEQVLEQARRSLAFHTEKQVTVAADLAAIREGRTGHRNPEYMIDETSKLLAHHRSRIAQIGAVIEHLSPAVAQAAE